MTAPLEYDIGATPVENAFRWLTSDADGAFNLPPVRGSDLVIPGLAGEVPQDRIVDVAYDEFAVRVVGLTAGGVSPADPVAQFHLNMQATRTLFFTTGAATLSVTKRIFYPAGPTTYGPAVARCVGFTPRLESVDSASILIRLKVYNGWAGAL